MIRTLIKLVRTLFLRWVKFLPTRVGGPLLWGWIYGAPQFPRWWWSTPRELSFSSGGHPRRGPRRVIQPPRGAPLEDQEWFSLEGVFPVDGVEPFAEVGWDYFVQQQDDNLELHEDLPTAEVDYLYGTRSGAYSDEDFPDAWEMDLFRRVETRETSYARDDHPGPDEVEFFDPRGHPRRGPRRGTHLGRLATPGEGPTSFNRNDNPFLYDGYYPSG